MEFILLFILSLSVNLDAFIISFNYGILKVKINKISAFIISFITFIFTYISMFFTEFVSSILYKINFNIIGNLIIIFMGLYGLIRSYKTKSKSNIYFSNFNIIKLINLGVLLSFNNFVISVGIKMSGYNVLKTSIISSISCYLLIILGNIIGFFFSLKNSNKSLEIISNIIMIIFGIFQFLC